MFSKEHAPLRVAAKRCFARTYALFSGDPYGSVLLNQHSARANAAELLATPRRGRDNGAIGCLLMVLGSHIVFSTYGFWLPNDPRGSWSDFVRSWELYRHGAATKVSTRFSRASHPHDTRARRDTKRALKYPAVRLNGIQARAVGRGFAALANKSRVCVWACSILPEHVHLVIERHRCPAEQLINLLKGQATRELIAEALHPLAAFPTRTGRMPKVFARGHWKVYLDRVDRIHAAIRYVQDNPIKEGKAPQKWSFVRAYGA